jgi:CO/xanthine dehydrogenase Mo-binding subunit/aerobic-type carbon monoxide dehydrogenase small subunit (CoxS/CutS family)
MNPTEPHVGPVTLTVNGVTHQLAVDPETPLLYILRNDLGLKGPKYGCSLEQCGACKVLIDGADVPCCQLPVKAVQGMRVTTLEGLGSASALHPLQEAFIEAQAIQCGYCVSGMIIAAQGLLNRTRYPDDDEIRAALDGNLCRCGVYERVRQAIKLRIGRLAEGALYEVITPPMLSREPAAPAALPPPLQETPDLDAWLRIETDGTIMVFTGKVEIGQGIKTTVAQLAAEELDVALARIRVVDGDTGQTPDEGVTAGSMSLQTSGATIRQAAAEARHHLLALAFEALESATPADQLVVADGTVTDPATGRHTTYWALFGGQRFGRAITGVAQPKPAGEHRVVGQAATRLDLPAKVTGAPSFVHDLHLPGMVYGRIVRPPGYDARLVAVDEQAVALMPGVLGVVRDGSFLGVIAEREEQAIAASAALFGAAVWENHTALPVPEILYDHLLSQPAQSQLIVDGTATDDPILPPLSTAGATQTLSATYCRPYQMHATLGPSAAVAQWVEGKLTIWSHTQGPYPLRISIAQVLEMDPADVRVIHLDGAGCYGHNGADDVALDAALLARSCPGRPVALQWTRADEHGWEPYGPAMVVKLQAGLDEVGRVSTWNHDVWSYPHIARPRPLAGVSGLLATWHLAKPWSPPAARTTTGARHLGGYRNADPLYDFPQRRIVSHLVSNSPLRTSALRSLGAYANVFAIESFMDELAQAAGMDPIAFRLHHLADERARAVIAAAAEKAGWQPHPRPAGNGRGWGIAFAQYKNIQCYCAIAVEVTVDPASGQIRLERAVIAADAGQVVNPDGLSNQLEGGFIQAASWTLLEAVKFDQTGIISRDWESYPILRFTAAPRLEVILLNRPELPFLGSGEASQNPTPAAIANALFDATGVRLRELPFTPERVRAASHQATAA